MMKDRKDKDLAYHSASKLCDNKNCKQDLEEAREGTREARKRIEEARKRIEESRKRIEESRKRIEESRKSIEESRERQRILEAKLFRINRLRSFLFFLRHLIIVSVYLLLLWFIWDKPEWHSSFCWFTGSWLLLKCF